MTSTRERTTWSRQGVVDAIRERYDHGQPMQCATPAEHRLYQAARRHFDSWEAAMRAAGLEPVRTRWSPDRVVTRLREEYPRLGYRMWDDTRLEAAAKRYFGGRRDALRAAGFRVRPSAPLRRWTPESLLAAVLERHAAGTLGQTWREDPSLYHSARNRFGTWRRAVEAAGLVVAQPRTRKEIVDAIRERHRRGESLKLVSRDDAPLFAAARGRFGSWRRAVVAAGFDVPEPRRWTRPTILAALRQYHENGGLGRMWREQKHLYYVAVQQFGSWPAALAEIGLRSQSVGRKWTPGRVLAELRRHLHAGDTSISISNPPLAAAARNRFGSLSAAWRALGVEPPRQGDWSAERVIEVIQDRYVRGLPIGRTCDGGPSLRSAAFRYFDGWRSALEAAGLAEHYVPPVAVRWSSGTEVLDEIRRLPHEAGRLTLPSTRVPELCRSARKHFGSWRRAVRAAGRDTLRRSWTRANVIAEIRALHDRGASLNSADHPSLVGAARRFFTGWHAALHAAGIPEGERHVA